MFLAHRAVVLDQARRRDEAVVVASQALHLATSARDWSTACLCHANLGSFHIRLGTVEDGISHLLQALRLGDQLGEAGGKTELARVYLGDGLSKLGRYREALDALSTAHARLALGKAMPWAVIAQNILARLYAILGQPERGWMLLDKFPADLPPAVLALLYINQARVLRAIRRPRGRLIADALELFARQKQHETDCWRIWSKRSTARQRRCRTRGPGRGRGRGAHARTAAVDAPDLGCACPLKPAPWKPRRQAHAMLAAAARSRMDAISHALLECLLAFEANRETASALDALHRGVAWINTAMPNVPDEFSGSFLERNPVNRAILAAANRRLHA
jgi:tetratricopeptide (TPR) repeat protein